MQVRRISLAAAALVTACWTPAAMAQNNVPPMNAGTEPVKPFLAPPDAAPPAHVVPALPAGAPQASAGGQSQDDQQTPFTPVMLGDFIGPVANLFTSFKIAEGESPRPLDRVFFKYNYYNDVEPARWTDPTQPVHNVNLNLYTFGAEKTFFDGIMSLGLRVPFYTINAEGKDFHIGPDAAGAATLLPGGPGFDETQIGNIIAIAKAVLWEDRPSGDLLSAGVVTSLPTASNRLLDPGMSTIAYLQPFTGFILNSGDLFVQGFSSMTMPLVRAESIIAFNDIGVGYYIYKDCTGSRMISAIAPTFEIHYTAPLRQADPKANLFNFSDDLRVHNTVDLTMGATFEIERRATLGMGIAVPVTGLRPFDVELLVQLNMMF
jgi:hypothetical protein